MSTTVVEGVPVPDEPEIPLERLQDEIKDELEEARKEGRREAEDVAPWPGFLSRRRYVQLLALSTAIFAVLAAIAALASGDYANEALFKANQSTLRQDQASDSWAEYQADGIKRIEYANSASLLTAQNAPQAAVQDAQNNSKREGDKQPGVMMKAQDLEQQASDLEVESTEQLEHHHRFAYSVTLFQVAIGLAALGALVNLQPLWWGSLVAGVAGLVLFVYGFAAIHDNKPKIQTPTVGAAQTDLSRPLRGHPPLAREGFALASLRSPWLG